MRGNEIVIFFKERKEFIPNVYLLGTGDLMIKENKTLTS